MKIVGITGGIGSGKSTVCRIFETLGIPVYNADDRAKYLMQNDADLVQNIKTTFGEEAYTNGQLNRAFLAKTIFHDSNKTAQINALVHPVVGNDFNHWQGEQQAPYVLKEAALMIESGSYKQLDFLINVFASIETRIQRVQKRDPQRSLEEINGIIDKQVSEEQRTERSDFVIDNDGSCLIIPQVLAIHQQLLS
ncbi:MAG: dephospho-CoA kinase [Reichenbachiella sp.]|uniref:dephospho-CoA kinase n=1 Tax=Reichenbachiella sp. TaxID=2184521 RepID=UPI002966818E|nr:dephospho-CoA kinase [Reichenbachiella sp.]MDW3208898.1 dephospho-CoA kinase [Reichenbachiella sp.]